MSGHPSLDDLVALAESLHAGDSLPEPVAEAHAHCATCPRCDVALQRLQAGLGILAEARAHRPPSPDWEALDDVMARAAEDAARKIRVGALRPVSRWREPMSVGFGFAVAAAALLAVRFVPPGAVPPVAGPALVAQAPVVTPPESPVRYEAAVLLSAGGARVAPTEGAEMVALSGVRALAEGSRIETTGPGRTVLSLAQGWRADVRGGTQVVLSALRDAETALRVAEGSVALAPSEGAESSGVRLAAGRWTVEANGPMVGTYTQSVLRVVLLAGRAEARAGDGERFQMVGPVVFDLPAVGPAARRIEPATDGEALDRALLAADGVWMRVPALESSARVTLGETGALPAAVEALRVHPPATLIARTSRGRMTLDLTGTEGLAWRSSPTVAHVGPAVPRPSRVVPSGQVALGGPVSAPPTEEASLTAAQQRAMVGRARPRVARCLSICQEQHRCPERLAGAVELSVSPTGQTSVAQLHPSLEGARRCLESEARFLHFPAQAQPYSLALPVGSPTP